MSKWGGGRLGVVMFGCTLSLSLRRSTINVENVVVRLWQSSAICLRAVRPQCFFIYWIATLCLR